jgi:hypothetical protein
MLARPQLAGIVVAVWRWLVRLSQARPWPDRDAGA